MKVPEADWCKSFGVDLGQVGAVIYKDSACYGIFADFLGKPTGGKDRCDPNHGDIERPR